MFGVASKQFQFLEGAIKGQKIVISMQIKKGFQFLEGAIKGTRSGSISVC